MRPRGLFWLALPVLVVVAIAASADITTFDRLNPGIAFFFNESFESVTPPTLPAGWLATLAQGQMGDPKWVTSATTPYDGANDVFAPDLSHVTDNLLDTPSIAISIAAFRPALVFWHSFNFELTNFDGGVVEIKIGNGAFTDIIAAGATALNNGYTGTISSCCTNPLAGRLAFTNNSGGYVRTVIALPSAALNQNVQFRFRLGTDSSGSGVGWRIDKVLVTAWATGDFDFNGDHKTDRTVYRPSNNVWYTALNGGGATAVGWGTSGDVDVSADYDNDGKNDVAVWRPSTGTWFILRSSDAGVTVVPWGQTGDIPIGGPSECCTVDGAADLNIWRPSTGTWFIKRSTDLPPITFPWGTNGDQPLLGDYSGIAWVKDLVIYRPTTGVWYIAQDGGQDGPVVVSWGTPGDVPVVGDWDGDGFDDVAVFRPSNGQWWIRNSHDLSTTVVVWGMNGDVPVTGDFNGDGRSDFTIWRPSNGVWFTQFSNTTSIVGVGWGVPGDLPLGRRPGS